MPLESKYSREVRDELSLFPVWRPGSKIEPGDIGTLAKGVFEKQTSVAEMFPGLKCAITAAPMKNPFRFVSKDCHSGEIAATGKVPAGSSPADVTGTIEIRFGAHGGVLFGATGITEFSIENLHEVRNHIENNRSSWPRGYVLVSAVDKARQFSVMVAENDDGVVKVGGKVDVLKHLNIADSGVSVVWNSVAGYQTKGDGPITLRTHGFNWWGLGTKLLSGDDSETSEDDFTEVSARDPVFD